MRRLPHVTWLRAFEAAARHSSFSAAAQELNLTPAAVSQQIRQLEQHLEIRLFNRLAKGVELTDLGQAYALPIRKSFLEMQSATDGLFRSERKSVIRLRASISFAALILAPRLAAFHRAHRGIEIALSTTVWADRMGDASIDLDLRYGDGGWPEMRAHPLQIQDATLICHPSFAPQLGPAPDPDALRAAGIVQITGSETDWDRLFDHCGFDQPRPDHWIKADSSLIALQILAGGHGCALISRSFAQQHLASGALVAPFDLAIPMGKQFFLVERDDLGTRPDIAQFRQWLLAQPL
ncbi:MAG: LysR substrate-binding domain-containing protein [Sulfitobacter sp.]